MLRRGSLKILLLLRRFHARVFGFLHWHVASDRGRLVSNFDEHGFLGGRICDWVNRHRRKHADSFATGVRLNVECHHFLSGREIFPSDQKKLVAAILFARMMELYQAGLLVLERGMSAASRALFRTHLEAYFTLVALLKDPSFLEDYLDQFYTHQKSVLNRIQNSPSVSLIELRERLDTSRIDEINALVKERNISRLSVEQVAERAGLSAVYATAYASLSGAVHSSAFDIESHIRFDETTQEIQAFRYGPSDSETERALGLMGMAMADSLERVSAEFDEDRSKICSDLKSSFEQSLA